MFDIGFTELLLLSVLALLVLGPERLPVAVKTIALWVGRFKQAWNSLRTEIEKEIGADEIKQQLHNEAILKSLGEDTQKLQENFQSIKREIEETEQSVHAAITTPSESESESEKSIKP